ncbi:uncharacterized protein [Dysidea avara]|uniref:uncharacterized protein n=1 Tax=Dysidea avara TaxID=196820 RepID=UPI00332473AC
MIVWLDETGSDRRSDRRKFGYHLRGMTPCNFRLIAKGKRMSAIAIMSERGIKDEDIYDGNINGDTFGSFVDRSGTNSRSVVVMDNASIHHVEKVAQSIQQTGAILCYLPSYSPDYNPLEESFAKVKAFLKSNEVVFDNMGSEHLLLMTAFNTITTEDCKGYIRHAGYSFHA